MFSKKLITMYVTSTVALCPITASAHENRIGNHLEVHKELLDEHFSHQEIDEIIKNNLNLDNDDIAFYTTLGLLLYIGLPILLFSKFPALSNGQGSSYDMTKFINPVVNQGDRISVKGTSCTIGYIDKSNRKAYTAAHCFVSDKTPGQSIDAQPVYNSFGRQIGVATGVYSGTQNDDFIMIDLFNNIPEGENSFSGDTIVKIEDVKPGDEICSFSRKYKKTMCGEIEKVNEREILATREAGGISGDSGGPAWVEGKGFVGVYTVSLGVLNNNGEKIKEYAGFTYPNGIE